MNLPTRKFNCLLFLPTVFGAVLLSVFAQPTFAQLTSKNVPVLLEHDNFHPKNCKLRRLKTRIRVVQNKEDLNNLLAEAICSKIRSETIDLEKFTLAGVSFFVSGCPTENAYRIEVWRDDVQKTFKVKAVVKRKNECRGMDLREIWILIPKLPPDYKAEFEREELTDDL
jgi:hypothetical protein